MVPESGVSPAEATFESFSDPLIDDPGQDPVQYLHRRLFRLLEDPEKRAEAIDTHRVDLHTLDAVLGRYASKSSYRDQINLVLAIDCHLELSDEKAERIKSFRSAAADAGFSGCVATLMMHQPGIEREALRRLLASVDGILHE